jgi:outer membrane protein TolC
MKRSQAISLILLACAAGLATAETPATMTGGRPPDVWRPPQLALGLDQAVRASLDNSEQLRSYRSAAEAAEAQALVQRGFLMPHLSIDGSYRYVTEVPELAVSPNIAPIAFTTHNSYSIGPDLTWTAFSGGTLVESWRSAQANARAQARQADAIRRQIRLAARLAYFQAQLAAAQVRLYAESCRVESAQYHDIQVRYKDGNAARVDLISEEQDLLLRQRQLLQARTNLAAAVRDLTSLAHLFEGLDPSWPTDSETLLPVSGGTGPLATLVVALDQVTDSIGKMDRAGQADFDVHQPQLQFLADLAEAARHSAKSFEGGHWPTLSVLASIMQEYPNGPIIETINQKTFGVNLSFPLFAGGSTVNAVRSAQSQAQSDEEKRQQTARDLLDSWKKAHDQAASLRLQQALNRRSVDKAAEVARLRYEAYLAGQGRFLDVEDANLKVLQAKIDAAATDVNLLVQLANLESLSKEN